MREITYAQALREAIAQEMRRDSSVYIMGEDIGIYGGTFKVTQGLIEEFGPERVRETPISETAFVGCAVGSAMTGLRPVVELMFSDFIGVCYDQILNQAAKLRYMSGGKVRVPMVLRAASGGGTGAAAQHSQSLESLFAHIPGLKVVTPSTAYDAKGLMITAIRDDNPVIFLEQKLLYAQKSPVPEDVYTIPFGVADIKRTGEDISVITYGRTVQMALEAAKALFAQGISVEVVDLRTLSPVDSETMLHSVKKTRRALIVHEAVMFGGFGGELAAILAQSDALMLLKAPVRRIGAQHCPVPFCKGLERHALPSAADIQAAICEMMV